MLLLPQQLPAANILKTATYDLRKWRDTEGTKRIGLLNLMPNKPVTELDIARTLQATALEEDLQLIPLKIKGQTYKTTPAEHMQACYVDCEEIEAYGKLDRLLITGAPVEQFAFEEVRYWKQLCHIMDWADGHAGRILYICWGAQAGLYHFYGIDKYDLPEKCFGIFPQQVAYAQSPLMSALTPQFLMPNSRHTAIRREDVTKHADKGLHILAEGTESGVGVVATDDCRHTFVLGHLEYEPLTLDKEYRRDLAKNLPIHAPQHYYNADGSVPHTWLRPALTFYSNWLAYK